MSSDAKSKGLLADVRWEGVLVVLKTWGGTVAAEARVGEGSL